MELLGATQKRPKATYKCTFGILEEQKQMTKHLRIHLKSQLGPGFPEGPAQEGPARSGFLSGGASSRPHGERPTSPRAKHMRLPLSPASDVSDRPNRERSER